MAAIRRLAVVEVATSVRQMELIALNQSHDEPVRSFIAKAKGIARNCGFEKKCTCDINVDYSNEVVKMVLLNGLADAEIKRDILGTTGLDDKSLDDTVALVESKEIANRSMGGSGETSNAATSYQKAKVNETKLKIKIKCCECTKEFLKHKLNRAGDKLLE